MPAEIDTWLQEKEDEARTELEQLEREVEKRRAALDMVRKWRSDLAKATPEDFRAARERQAKGALNGMPKFNQSTDPTGKRRAIWTLLNEKRPRSLSPSDVRKTLIERDDLSPHVPPKDIQIAMRRMARTGQIENVGRAKYRLPPLPAKD